MATVTLTTDFGISDPFVGIMKGVLASRAPAARVIDVTHAIPPQDVLAGALVLRHAAPFFPPGTIHVAVVDPGVGTARRALCVETTRALFVGPDNGVLTLAAEAAEVRRIVHVTDERFFLSPRSTTFHGRDVFAPVAAALATGTPAPALGPAATGMRRVSVPAVTKEGSGLRAEVIYVDGFGNLVTNVSHDMLPSGPVAIRLGSAYIRGIAPSYATVAPGQPLAVVNSWGLLEIAVREGSARTALGGGVGALVIVEPAAP